MQEPLILVFYIDRQTLEQQELREEYSKSIRKYFSDLKLNPAIFFFPTDDGNERLECINPRYIEDQNEVEKLKKLLADVENTFDIQNNDNNRIYSKKMFDEFAENALHNLKTDNMADEEDSDDPLGITYSDLTEDMRNKIAYYDKKYHEHFNLLNEIMKLKIERGNDFEPTDLLYKNSDVKKGQLFNQVYKNRGIGYNVLLNKEQYEIIEKLGDNPKIWVTDLPVFLYDGKSYSVTEKNPTDMDSIYEMIDKMDGVVVIHNILTKEYSLVDPKTMELKLHKRYMIRYRQLPNVKVS